MDYKSFRDRDYGISRQYQIEEIARTFPTNKQVAVLLALMVVGGSTAGFGAALALNLALNKSADFRSWFKHFTLAWSKKIYGYTEQLESDVLKVLEPVFEGEVFAYKRHIALTAFGAAFLDAVVQERRNSFVFIVEKKDGEGPKVKHSLSGWLRYEEKTDLFRVFDERGSEMTEPFQRDKIVNLFQIRHRPCVVVRIYR